MQIPGIATRIRAEAFREELDQTPMFRDRCLRHVQVTMVQAAQAAACNARHELTERLARWLLMSRKRSLEAAYRPVCVRGTLPSLV